MSNIYVHTLSDDEMHALIDEFPELSESGAVYRIVEHADCYDVYVDESETSPNNPFNHVFVFDKPLLHTNQ